MFDSLINFGVTISVIGVVLSGVIALVSGKNSRSASWILAGAGALGAVGSIAFLFGEQGTVVFAGPLTVAFGLSLTLNKFSAIFFVLLSIVVASVGVYSTAYLANYTRVYNIKIVQTLTALFVLGMQGVLLSSNIFGFLFFWEVMSLSSFFLVMTERTADSVRAAFQYFVMTHLGAMALFAAFMLLGNGAMAAPIMGLFAQTQATSAVIVGAALLFLFGFGSKAGLVPFHVWLPEAHPQAPSQISALMSGVMLKMAVYGFIITVGAWNMPQWYALIVIALGMISAVYGVLYAVIEKDMKRALAYSSIENMGLIFMMLGTGLYFGFDSSIGKLAVLFAIFHVINHALFKSGLFMAAGAIISQVHTKSMEQMGGLAKRMPLFSFFMLVLALAAAALPPFGTFFGEWGFVHTIVSHLMDATIGDTGVGLLVLLLSVVAFVGGMAIFAMVKIFAIPMLAAPRSQHAEHAHEPEIRLAGPVGVLAVGMLAVGIGAHAIINHLGQGSVYESMYGAVGNNVAPVSSAAIAAVCILALCGVCIARKLMSAKIADRVYQTWNCGQPITPGMEYTATAFSAPIRFFFRFMLRSQKNVLALPIVASNPWIARRTFELNVRSVWHDRLYRPIALLLHRISAGARKIQSGRVQLYLLLVFVTFVVTLFIAL